MVIMVVMGSNVVMKNSSNGSNGSNHEAMDLKMDHVIMKTVNCSNLVVMVS